MAGVIQRMAMVSMCTSSAAESGLAAELAVRGIEVDVLTRAAGAPTQTEIAPGVWLRELAAGGPGAVSSDRVPEVSDAFGEEVAALARSRGYDILHAHHWRSGIATLPVSIELSIPFVQSFHSLAAMRMASLPGVDEPVARVRSEMFLATQADALVASSSAEATALIDDVGAPADRTWIIPPGVDLERFAPRSPQQHARIRLALGLESDRPLVVIAGRVIALKGHELAVRALAELHALRGWAPVLVIAGESTDVVFESHLWQLAGDLGVAQEVRFVGPLNRDDLADLLAAAAVTIVPSYTETFGSIALESAAAGTPVIGFRSGGLSESIEEGVSGLLLGTREPRYWATEIANLIENDERRSTLALTARAHAERFSWGTTATSLLGIYAGVTR